MLEREQLLGHSRHWNPNGMPRTEGLRLPYTLPKCIHSHFHVLSMPGILAALRGNY